MDWVWVVVMALRAVSPAADDRWATVLAELDRGRETAFAQADPRRLEGTYVRGTAVKAVDARTISQYASRGGRVVGARLQLLSCRVVEASPRRARLDVVDRLGPARVVWDDGTTTPLPRDRPTRRLVTLTRTSDGWRVAASSQVSPR
jgi:hypothetical protein